MDRPIWIGAVFVAVAAWCGGVSAQPAAEFDVVIANGRVMDPETGLDAVRHVGIRQGQIAAVSERGLSGREVIDAAGLVVAPGFIDLHAHGQNAESRRLQAHDGVTTALELEIGVYPVGPWYREHEGQSLIHYGATVGHLPARVKVKEGIDIGHSATAPMDLRAGIAEGGWAYEEATEEEIDQIAALLEEGIHEGALGVGFGIAYTPRASRKEIFRMFQTAARLGAPCYVHSRSSEDYSDTASIGPIQELLANVAATGASLHVVHVNSSGGANAPVWVEMIRGARARGLDVSTEVYPYAAGSTLLQSALFDTAGQEGAAIQYEDIMWVQTGERLTAETFAKYREIGGWVVIFNQDPEIISWLVRQPDVIIATDGIPFVNGLAHPRGAGTFGRILGQYVREEKALGLMEALRKMTLMPAQRVEGIAPMMRLKGRIRAGADADITVFNPDTVMDRATFQQPAQSTAGIVHVLVSGTFVVKDGEAVEGVTPGRAVVNARLGSP